VNKACISFAGFFLHTKFMAKLDKPDDFYNLAATIEVKHLFYKPINKLIYMKMMERRVILTLSVLFLAFACIYPSSKSDLKIISYNVLVGMESDSTSNKKLFANWIDEQKPDIIAFQEMNEFTQKSFEEFARQYGHPYAVLLKEEGYPVALSSRYPIVNVSKVLDNMHHGFIQARVKDINIIVLHLSPHKYKKRNEEIKVILETIRSYPPDQKWMIMGDFNSVSPLDSKHYSNGILAKSMESNDRNYDYIDNLIDGKTLDFGVHQKILDSGMIDALYQFHPGSYISTCDTKRYTQNSKEDYTSRIDFIYVSGNVKNDLLDCKVIKDNFTDYYSDHYPVVVEIKD